MKVGKALATNTAKRKVQKKQYQVGGIKFTLVMGVRWYLDYYEHLHNGLKKRHRDFLHNRTKDLIEREQLFVQSIHEIAYQKKETEDSSFGVAGFKSILAPYLLTKKNELRPNSHHRYEKMLERFFRYLIEKWYVKTDAGLTPAMTQGYINYEFERGRHNNSVRYNKNVLSSLYKLAATQQPNHFATIKLRKVGATSLLYFDQEKIDVLKKHIAENDPQLLLAVELLYYCFIRPNEIRQLKVGDVLNDVGLIRVRSEISKNKKEERVQIPIQLEEKLKTYCAGVDKNHFLFGNNRMTTGIVGLGTHSLYLRHKSCLKAVGIEGHYSLYSWKHTGAVKVVQNGINIKELQNQLRHHSLDMVQEYLKNLGIMESVNIKNKFPTM